MSRRASKRGFVALLSVITIAAILLVMLYVLNVSNFFAQFDALDAEQKSISESLALACVSAAQLYLAEDPLYLPPPGGECVEVGGSCETSERTCKICSIERAGNTYSIGVRAMHQGSYTNIRAESTRNGDAFDSTVVEEQPLLAGEPCPLQ